MKINSLSRKIYLELPKPGKDDQASAQERILRALPPEYGRVHMPCRILRQLYPLCEQADWNLTVILG